MKNLLLPLVTLVVLFAVQTSYAESTRNHVAPLSGQEEVPPVDTKAQGQAISKLRGGTLDYKLIVANIQDVVAAHIHCAPAGSNGSVGVTLFAGVPTTINGILTQGPILAPDSENGCGWANIGDVIDAIQSGDTYVNVHTLANLAGEIRGQIR